MKLRILKKKPRRFRTLRTFQRVAYKDYICDHCHYPISPGELYEGSVTATTYHIVTYRKHIETRCPVDPFEEGERIHRESEVERPKKEHPARQVA